MNNVILFTDVSDNVTIRNAVNDLTGRHAGYVLILSGGPENFRFILGSTKKDCKAALSILQQALSIKGGGTAEMVQGTISASGEAIETAFSQLL